MLVLCTQGVRAWLDQPLGHVRPREHLEARHGQLWMTGNRGFYRVARAELDAILSQGGAKSASPARP